jgi:hypothetical protein
MAPRKIPATHPSSERTVIVQHRPESKTRITLELNTSLADLYEEQGIARGLTLEDILMERLHRCQSHTATKPLYMNDAQRAKLEEALGHNFTSVEQAIAQIITATTLQVADVGVEIRPQLAARLATRVFRGETWEQVIQREVIRGLEAFCGMR